MAYNVKKGFERHQMKTIKRRSVGNLCGKHLKAARESRGLTQTELAMRAQLLGLPTDKKAISLIENGKRYFLDIELITFAKALNIPAYYLIDGVPSQLNPVDEDCNVK